jgi:hypothetical protein
VVPGVAPVIEPYFVLGAEAAQACFSISQILAFLLLTSKLQPAKIFSIGAPTKDSLVITREAGERGTFFLRVDGPEALMASAPHA